MRLWNFHPQYLDPAGLVALWREGLLAQAVLKGETKGYTRHPQLSRFRTTPDPLAAIRGYLYYVWLESQARKYQFDLSKIKRPRREPTIIVTAGQLKYERKHLLKKLKVRNENTCKHYPIPVGKPILWSKLCQAVLRNGRLRVESRK